jgi:DNA recombination protein RmuC
VLVTARKLDALDESKVIGEPRSIDESPKHLTQNEFAVLDELGVGRPELELPAVERTAATADGPTDRQTA